MIINSSQISMDASTGHKDVSTTTQGRVLSRNHSGKNDPHFTLSLKDILTGRSSGDDSLEGVFRSKSSIAEKDGRTLIIDNNRMLSQVISRVTGEEARVRRFDPSLYRKLRPEHIPEQLLPQRRFFRIGGTRFSMFFSSVKTYCEYEFYNYNCTGSVTTGDGRAIDFSLDLSVQRTTMVQETITVGTSSGYLVDPLVLDFEGSPENLFDQPFLFDLDGDGSRELISGPPRGCGFLALDRNSNNLIDDGTELFGPLRGSGFADLAVHDDDGNHWIDENDAIFDKLAVWMNPSGNVQHLQSLKDAGIGAISLAHAGSLFNLKAVDGTLLGEVDATGIFLTEDGEAKSLRDIRMNILDLNNHQEENEISPQLKEIIALHGRALNDLLFRQQRRQKEEGKSRIEQFITRMLSATYNNGTNKKRPG